MKRMSTNSLTSKAVSVCLALALAAPVAIPVLTPGIALAAVAKYSVASSAKDGGSISPAGTVDVKPGGKVAFTVTPDAGYEIDRVEVNGATFTRKTTFTLKDIQANQVVVAYFKKAAVTSYTISASSTGNGSISPSGSVAVKSGDNQTFTFTAKSGNTLADLVVDGKSVSVSGDTYTFKDVGESHTIKAVFMEKVAPIPVARRITASAGVNGSISPSGKVDIVNGDDRTFTITPKSGYEVKNVLVDGKSVGAVTSYTFRDVRENHTISATFVKTVKTNLRITDAFAKSVTANSATLVVKVAGASKYTIAWESSIDSGFKTIKNSNKATLKYSDLKSGTTYSVRCIVTDAKGARVTSSVISFTTKSATVTPAPTNPPVGNYPCGGVIIGSSVNVRSAASTTARSITTLHKGDNVTVLGFASSSSFAPGFYKIQWGSGYAYIAANYISLRR